MKFLNRAKETFIFAFWELQTHSTLTKFLTGERTGGITSSSDLSHIQSVKTALQNDDIKTVGVNVLI
jgi:hypothetical protein